MIINGVFVTTDVSLVPRQASTDNRGARPMSTRIDVHNHLPPVKAAAARRVNVDHIATKLAAITKALRTKPRPAQPAVDVQQRHDATPARLAEMNRRNREYWFGNKR
jgi:hypothetical protein